MGGASRLSMRPTLNRMLGPCSGSMNQHHPIKLACESSSSWGTMDHITLHDSNLAHRVSTLWRKASASSANIVMIALPEGTQSSSTAAM